MGRWAAALAALGLGAVLGGCTKWGIFEDVGADPHPPTAAFVALFRVDTITVDKEKKTVLVTPPFDGTAYAVSPGNVLQLRLSFSDAGGDLVQFKLRDRDGALEGSYAPAKPDRDGDGIPDADAEAPEFFRGTRGEADLLDIRFDEPQDGIHRMEFWAEDSHGSRSAKSEFQLRLTI